MSGSGETPRLGWAARALLGAVLPPERREEFIGDLMEEAAARGGDTRGFIAGQIWRSLPSLVVARLRRAPVTASVAVPAVAGGFGAFLMGGRRSAWRSFAIALSVAVHVGVLATAIVWGMWVVEEISPRFVPVVIWNGMPAGPPPDFALDRAKQSQKQQRKPRTRVEPRMQPQQVRSVAPVETIAGDRVDATDPPGTDVGTDGPGGDVCPPGATCATTAPPPPQMLPPKVAEKSCIGCALPRLPPAYRMIGTVHDMLVRICVGADGGVTSLKVLRSIGGAADASVLETLASWRFSPYTIAGRPVPFCYATRFLFSAE